MAEKTKICAICGAEFSGDTLATRCPACYRRYRNEKNAEYRARHGIVAREKKRSTGTQDPNSIIRGVSWHAGIQKWYVSYRGEYLGTFDALEDAIQVRKMAEADGPKRFCVVCGNPIPPESIGNVLTCSSECSKIRMQQNSRKREQRKKAEQQKFCAVCGKPIQKLTRGTAKYCSEACRDKAYRAKKEGTE